METISHVPKSGKLSNMTSSLIFQFEASLLRSTSLFPYFMLVAYEAGGFFRSLLLFLSYPLVWLLGEETHMGLNIMVFLSFFGVKMETFRIGSSVLPKFFLQDVGLEGFEAVMSFQRKVGFSNMPRVMVETFLKDYLGAETVEAREIVSFRGYYLGVLMKQDNKSHHKTYFDDLHSCNNNNNVVAIVSHHMIRVDHELFSRCKNNVYVVNDGEKRSWEVLPREKYPKAVIFHDGRLALRPTPSSSLALFMWIPLGLCLSIFRVTFGVLLPFNMSAPILAFSGTRTTLTTCCSLSEKPQNNSQKGMLYVCNHRTLLDPLYISYVINKPLCAVTYSLSRFNEVVSPIKTIRLTRDREKDRERMRKLLCEGSVCVCPEGTTCREPYLLRFSPMFAELTDEIVPVAVDVGVTMFYGSTATGNKALDPFYHYLNPNPSYDVKIMERICPNDTCQQGGKSRIEVANQVQRKIGKALGFECTGLTRKDKYMTLAGHHGIITHQS